MHLRYMFTDKRKTLAHPFHVKSTWQLLPIQKSVASEYYREQTKLARTCFNSFPHSFRYIVISQRMREKLSAHLNVIAKSIFKKLMKEQLQSLWTPHKKIIEEGSQQSDDFLQASYESYSAKHCPKSESNSQRTIPSTQYWRNDSNG